MASAEVVFRIVDVEASAAAPASATALDSWILSSPDAHAPPLAVRSPLPRRGTWPRNIGGFFAASLLLHVAALAAVVHPWPRWRMWQLRLPQGHNSVALAASVSSPRSEAEATVRLESPRAESSEEPLERRDAEMPAVASAEFASARIDARVPPPADLVRRDLAERPDRPDRPLSAPPKRMTDAKLPPHEAVVSIESPASAPAAASSGVKKSAPPTVVVSVRPVYPPAALAAGMHGVVRIRVRVNAKGEVTAASLYESSGYALLDQAALDVIYRWRYSPPDGEAGVAAEFVDKISFEITRQPKR